MNKNVTETVLELDTRLSGGADRIEYHWGKDLSGTLDGAAGVGGLLYVKRNGAICVPFYDAFGNVMGYWDENGVIVAEYAYDAFGRTVSQSGSLADTFAIRYSTKYYDAETEMYYYGKRFYMAALCRWLTRDPIEEEGGVNLYGFCGNDGVGSFDVVGLKRWVLFYYNRTDQVEFRKAAETLKREIESRGSFIPACDKVISKGVLTVEDFCTQWASAKRETDGSDPNLKVEEVHFFTHSAPGKLHLRGGSMEAKSIKELSKLNWAAGGSVICHGCNSGLSTKGGIAIADAFAQGQGVIGVGQQGFSSFSTSQNKRTPFSVVSPFSRSVYLWTYGEGTPGNSFGDRRGPYIFGDKWMVVP